MRNRIVASLTLIAGLGLAGCGSSGNGSSSTSGASSGASSSGATTHSSTASTAASSSSGASSSGSTTVATNGSSTSSGSSGSNTATNSSSNSSGVVTNASSSSGSSGSSSGSASSSSGSSSSGSGTTNANCGPNGVACAPGQVCAKYPAVQGLTAAYYACGCIPYTAFADGGAEDDSCSDNIFNNLVADGGGGNLSLCDPQLFTCRQPMDQELANQFAQTTADECAPTYTAIRLGLPYADGGQSGVIVFGDGGFSGTYPDAGIVPDFVDGGLYVTCWQGCDVHGSADCSATDSTCYNEFFATPLSDGGLLDGGSFCYQSLCGPDDLALLPDAGFVLEPDAGVTYLNGDAYYGACNAHGTGDGFCQPLGNNAGTGYVGVCFAPGTAATGAACSGFAGPVTGTPPACVAGDLCFGTLGVPSPQNSGIATTGCVQTCNANSGVTGPTTPACPNGAQGTPLQCLPLNGDPAQNDLSAGACE